MKKYYYDQSAMWQNDYGHLPVELERINETINAIPKMSRSVFDIGCGNGFFINSLYSRFPKRFERIVGSDVRLKGLEFVQTQKVMASIDALPFESRSFDLVSCLEVLEHLPLSLFMEGIAEIERVSRQFILISVPNDEILTNGFVICPNCSCAFHRNYHVRRFNKDILNNLFVEFKPIMIKEIGPARPYLKENKLFVLLRLVFSKKRFSTHSICPQCGYYNEIKSTNGEASMPVKHYYNRTLFSLINSIIKKMKKRWLLALFSNNHT